MLKAKTLIHCLIYEEENVEIVRWICTLVSLIYPGFKSRQALRLSKVCSCGPARVAGKVKEAKVLREAS